MINPMQIMQMMKGGSPQQAIMNMMRQQAGNNPVLKNAIDMAEKGDVDGLKNLAHNLGKENGIDVDEKFSEMKDQFGMK